MPAPLTRRQLSPAFSPRTVPNALGISIRLKPPHGPPQRIFHRKHFPSQFPLSLPRRHPHLLLPHPHGINRRPRFFPQQPSRHKLIHHASSQSKKIRQLDRRRRQPCQGAQLVENLLQRQILPPQNIPFPT